MVEGEAAGGQLVRLYKRTYHLTWADVNIVHLCSKQTIFIFDVRNLPFVWLNTCYEVFVFWITNKIYFKYKYNWIWDSYILLKVSCNLIVLISAKNQTQDLHSNRFLNNSDMRLKVSESFLCPTNFKGLGFEVQRIKNDTV